MEREVRVSRGREVRDREREGDSGMTGGASRSARSLEGGRRKELASRFDSSRQGARDPRSFEAFHVAVIKKDENHRAQSEPEQAPAAAGGGWTVVCGGKLGGGRNVAGSGLKMVGGGLKLGDDGCGGEDCVSW